MTYLIKVDLDTSDVGSSNGNHAKESIPPSAEHYEESICVLHLGIFHSQATRSFNTNRSLSRLAINGETENKSPKPIESAFSHPLPHAIRTSKVPSALDDPRSRRMEPMVVPRRKIDNHKKQLVSRFQPWQSIALQPLGGRLLFIDPCRISHGCSRRYLGRLFGKGLGAHADHHLCVVRLLRWGILFHRDVLYGSCVRGDGCLFVALFRLLFHLNLLVR